MNVVRLRANSALNYLALRPFANNATAFRNEEEYTPTPQYPPILDLSPKKIVERKKDAEHEKIKEVKTVEEKQIKLNMPRFYGFKSYMLTEDFIPYDNLALAQHATKTHLIVTKNLPDYYKTGAVDDLVSRIKSDVEETILIELEGYRRIKNLKEDIEKGELEDIVTAAICKQLNRLVINKMCKNYSHLLDVEVDIDSRIESSWYVGGMKPPESIKRIRNKVEWMKSFADDPVDRLMVYHGSPTISIRSQLPLNSIVPFSEAENPDLFVPFFQLDPQVLNIRTEHKHMANIPGFWPGDPYRFGLISYHKRGHLINRQDKFGDLQDHKEALHRQGILASFGWLSAQANMLGFNTFNDITYPLVTQTVITNGKLWSFYVYQMNTMLLHSRYFKENPKTNICWATEELPLYQEVKDGKLVGFNDEVLKFLLQMYANAPETRLGINLTPYLKAEEKVSADYQDDEKRIWLEREYKYLVANRPRHHEIDEVYSWEKIYKIDNKTRFMEKRLRPFELFVKPHHRRLDDRNPIYIPRKLRPDLPRWKGRYVKEHFP